MTERSRHAARERVEAAFGKNVPRDIDPGFADEDSSQFEPEELAEDYPTETY